MHTPVYAALLNIGSNPLIGLIVLALIVGVVVYFAVKLLAFASFIDEKFKQLAIWLIYAVGAIIVVDRALQVLFGISIFNGG